MTTQTKAAHTKGPWHYGKHSREIHAHGVNIARVGPGMLGGMHAPNAETQDANARLIAASPDLLEALDECARELAEWVGFEELSQDSGSRAIVERARAALRKARGEAA